MKTIQKFTVVPSLPERLNRLRDIAMNLWWSWEPQAIQLFFRLGREVWEESHQNPIRLLGEVSQSRLAHLAEDETFLAHMDRVLERLDSYMGATTWYQSACGGDETIRIAYYSAEYGITDGLPIYSGGLGILAGDHLKSASDLGLPLVSVGLLYRQGYFRQYLNADGWQQQMYPENDFYNMPIELLTGEDGQPLTVTVECPHPVHARVWRAQVGRVPLYLLDANLSANAPADREITARLYGGDKEMRIRQEVLLGIGGCRALKALGIDPTICHVNEGHAAFLSLERARCLRERSNLSVAEALELVKAGTTFTTHTPVPAGHDVFSEELIDKYLGSHISALGLSRDELLALGRKPSDGKNKSFNMTMLAMRLAAQTNGVSVLHGEVSREMMTELYPDFPIAEVPISSITNGVHIRSWISFDLAELHERYLGPRWVSQPGDLTIWERVDNIPDTELWRTHERRRERLVVFARERLARQLRNRGMTPTEVAIADEVLDPEALTIGFARRFATYKRGTLLFRDPERLARILRDAKRPVQIIFAGKAHPADNAGKEFIRQIIHHSRTETFRHHIVFLEDYDMNVARYILQGVDVWLNNPQRKQEASGTSGMKATANGALNMSIPDGWWCEGFDGENGWNIGQGEDYDDHEYQDRVESEDIYEMLENEIIPMFYSRGTDGLPREWIRRMKHAMRTICPVFNTNRMVQEYTELHYLPLAARQREFQSDDFARIRELSAWKQRVRERWGKIRVLKVEGDTTDAISVGGQLPISAEVHLGDLSPEDVAIEIFFGQTDHLGQVPAGRPVRMAHVNDLGNGNHAFRGALVPEVTGRHGFSIRVLPDHRDLVSCTEMAMVIWS
jgi:glycogen phosphorylase